MTFYRFLFKPVGVIFYDVNLRNYGVFNKMQEIGCDIIFLSLGEL
jgi:hypothetical protein